MSLYNSFKVNYFLKLLLLSFYFLLFLISFTKYSERKPSNWVSSCYLSQSSSSSITTTRLFHSQTDLHYIILCGDNGLVYVFDINTSYIDPSTEVQLCPIISVIELPPQARSAVAISSISPCLLSTLPSLPTIYLIILLDIKSILLIEGVFQESINNQWVWNVMLNIPISQLSEPSLYESQYAHSLRSSENFIPKFYPNTFIDLKLATKKDFNYQSKNNNNTVTIPNHMNYCLASCTILGETSRYGLISEGILYLFDWMTVFNEYHSKSHNRNIERLLSRSVYGSNQSSNIIIQQQYLSRFNDYHNNQDDGDGGDDENTNETNQRGDIQLFMRRTQVIFSLFLINYLEFY